MAPITDHLVEYARQCQELLMGAVVRVNRPGRKEFEDGEERYTAGAESYAGIGSVQAAEHVNRTVQSGGQTVTLSAFVVKLPWHADVRVGDVVTVDSAPHDPNLWGRTLTIRDVEFNSVAATCRRCTATLDAG